MPLVNAENDESFVLEVGDAVRESCTRTNDHICAMIEEYLRRRIAKVRSEMEEARDTQIAQMNAALSAVEAEKAAEQEGHASARRQLAKAAEALQHKDARMRLQHCFFNWKRGVEWRRERRRLANEAGRHQERLSIFHAYAQWRLFATARRNARLEAAELAKRDRREEELLQQLAASTKLLAEEREKNEALNEKLKEAFVRGMCALNREAVQVLHGADEKQEDDVEAIAEILSRDSHSRKLSTPQAKREEGSSPSSGHNHSICPVHQVDQDGYFYHRCYAPGYCVYDEHRPRSRTPPSSSSASASAGPPTPFVVRADPRAVRNFNAVSSVPLRHTSKPSQTRWKL